MAEILDVVCVLDESSGDEAIYINGELKLASRNIFAGDIIRTIGGEKQAIRLRQAVIDQDFSADDWPKTLADLKVEE